MSHCLKGDDKTTFLNQDKFKSVKSFTKAEKGKADFFWNLNSNLSGAEAHKVLGESVVLYKDLIVGEKRFARLPALGLSEVLNAKQTWFKKIYSEKYR